MLDQFLATLRDSDLVVPVFCFSYNRRCGNRNSRVVNSDREPIATLFIWRIQLGKGIGSKKNDCQKKLNDSIESESKKKKREEKASQHQHIFNKRNKFTKIHYMYIVTFTSYPSDNAVKSIHVPPDLIWEATRMNLFLSNHSDCYVQLLITAHFVFVYL